MTSGLFARLRANAVEAIVAAAVLIYATVIAVGAFSYNTDARLYPLVAGVLGMAAGGAYLVSVLRTAPVAASDPAGRPDTDVLSRDGSSETDTGTETDSGTGADTGTDATAPGTDPAGSDASAKPSVVLTFGAVLAGLLIFAVVGVYPYVLIFSVLFGTLVVRLSWRQSILIGLGLCAFTYLLFELVMGVDVWSTGWIAG